MAKAPTTKAAQPGQAASKEETLTYLATTPILHDGDTYQPGDEIELTAAQAATLGSAVTPPAAAALPEIPKE